MRYTFFTFILFTFFLSGSLSGTAAKEKKPVHHDTLFWQDYSIKYYYSQPGVSLKKAAADRNGKIQILSSH
ncbi:MAG: hypothetical protein PHH93_07425, partial [Prolixibacteraceae bacterium]|nr:hypothetical protein [Prolixibacteraceae bacterium]